MKWKIKDNAPKQSISSNNSMSFLTDEALTFHRFSDGSISINGRRSIDHGIDDGSSKSTKKNSKKKSKSVINEHQQQQQPNKNGEGTSFPSPIWTTTTTAKQHQSTTRNGTSETHNEFQFISPANNESGKTTLRNGSTMKLMSMDDQNPKQSRCSVFRGVILCLCLNVTYANIVRFPRELERHGSAFLIPYFTLLLFIGLPIVLLEIALGQFLGQGSAYSWRASPFFRGASIVGRIASWLGTIWVSLHAIIAVMYVGQLSFKSLPFNECATKVKIINFSQNYVPDPKTGQECVEKTLFVPVWENTLYFGLLALALILVWVISMFSTHSGKVNRRMIFTFGFIGLSILFFETGWEIVRSITKGYFPDMWAFSHRELYNSTLWFNALVQVIFSTNIGVGALPVITSKFLYKGDAVRTSIVYICFNVFINAVAVTYYLTQFDNPITTFTFKFPELSGLTVIYDHALVNQAEPVVTRLIAALTYFMIILSAIITISICIYSSSKIIYRHPSYSMCLSGLVLSIAAIICPQYVVARVLDARIVGTLIIGALIFELIAISWVYGAKNLYTDLEFSIGRPIFKIWIMFWVIAPIIMLAILIWWTVIYTPGELGITYVPKWAPIAFTGIVMFILACIAISKEVDYNFFSMISASMKPSKDWGPGDPLVRHAWKQWRSVCEDTGERDFTLRRRGTRDYTNSIKRGGQYPHSRYGTNRNISGSNSPNYSDSIFGDSAIEEDMSVDKYQNFRQLPHRNGSATSMNSPKSSSNNVRKVSGAERRPVGVTDSTINQPTTITIKTKPNGTAVASSNNTSSYFIRPNDDKYSSSQIEITPQLDNHYRISLSRNPMARVDSNPNYHRTSNTYSDNYGSYPHSDRDSYSENPTNNPDHICWRKYSGNSEEFSTEL